MSAQHGFSQKCKRHRNGLRAAWGWWVGVLPSTWPSMPEVCDAIVRRLGFVIEAMTTQFHQNIKGIPNKKWCMTTYWKYMNIRTYVIYDIKKIYVHISLINIYPVLFFPTQPPKCPSKSIDSDPVSSRRWRAWRHQDGQHDSCPTPNWSTMDLGGCCWIGLRGF